MAADRISPHTPEARADAAQPWPCRSEGFAEDLDPVPGGAAPRRSGRRTRARGGWLTLSWLAPLAAAIGVVALLVLR